MSLQLLTLFLAFNIWSFVEPSWARNAQSCNDLLGAISHVDRLSTLVYSININGAEKVIRLPSLDEDPLFEVFASHFINASPTVHTPTVQVLSSADKKNFLEHLKTEPRNYNALWRDASFRAFDEKSEATIVEFSKGTVGATYLKNLEMYNRSAGNPDFSISKNPEAIPERILAQIADGWALFTALGIPDFHSHNWLVNDERVIPIDMALNVDNSNQSGKTRLELRNHHSPFKLGGPVPYGFLIGKVSEPLASFLASLNHETFMCLLNKVAIHLAIKWSAQFYQEHRL